MYIMMIRLRHLLSKPLSQLSIFLLVLHVSEAYSSIYFQFGLGVESSGFPDAGESVEGLFCYADRCGDFFAKIREDVHLV